LADWVKGLNFSWVQERIKSLDGQHIPNLKIEERVRQAFTELGTTFIKLGQALSTRPDLVGPEMARELANLQTAAPADPPDTVRTTIEAEFGKSSSELFAHFSEAPLASASIAQVHVARLQSGEHVVVKVQHARHCQEDHARPGYPRRPGGIGRKTLSRAASLSARRGGSPVPPLPCCGSWISPANGAISRSSQNSLLRDDTVHFPRAYEEFSTRRVLTMEQLEGILGTDHAALAASGADLDEFAHRGANMYLQMIFRDAFYHADPHPGNLMLLPGGVVGVLDCGMVGRLDEELAGNP
jgi:ubiquinone biosynthesis protein